MKKDLKVIGLTKRMLRDGINQHNYWSEEHPPFPKSKALWLLTNPRILEDDYCCVITLEDTKLISFIYMIPDVLNVPDKIKTKVYWMISWWVHPEYKNTVLGTYTFYEALKLADNKIIIKFYAEHIADFYAKQPFTVIASRLRYTIFFSADPSMLMGKFKFLKPFRILLNTIDFGVAAIIKKMNYNKLKNNTKTLKYHYLNELDDETWNFIEPLCANDLILKTKAYVNWYIDNKQYTQLVVPSKHKYHALETGESYNIYNHSLKIIKDDKTIGFISYIINFNECNVKYFLVEKEVHYNTCVDALIENFISKIAKFIFTDDPKLAETILKRFQTVFTYKSEKKGLAHNSLNLTPDIVNLLNSDGHFY